MCTPVGQARLQLLDLLLDALGDGQRILAVPHQHDAAGHFVAVLLEDAAAELRAELHGGDVLDVDRRAVDLLDDGVFDVVLVLDPADAADDVLGVVLLDDAAAGRHVALGDGGVQLAERDAVGPQVFGPHVDLIFQRRAADDGHVGDARRGVQLRGDVELVERPQPARIDRMLGARLDRVPEDLPERRGVGGQVGHDARRQKCVGLGQLLGHALAGEVEVDVVLEDDRDHREVEFGRRAHGRCPPAPAACATADR